MRQIPASKFKEQCLALLEDLDPDGIVITKRGKPMAKLIPLGTESASLIGSLRGKLEMHQRRDHGAQHQGSPGRTSRRRGGGHDGRE